MTLRNYSLANYERTSGIGTAELTRINSNVIKCGQYSDVLGCDRSEEVVFDVQEELIRQIAARPADKLWRIKFRATAGKDWEEQIAPAEAAGLLAAIDAYNAGRRVD